MDAPTFCSLSPTGFWTAKILLDSYFRVDHIWWLTGTQLEYRDAKNFKLSKLIPTTP